MPLRVGGTALKGTKLPLTSFEAAGNLEFVPSDPRWYIPRRTDSSPSGRAAFRDRPLRAGIADHAADLARGSSPQGLSAFKPRCVGVVADNEPVITLDFNLLLSPTRLPRRGLRTRLRVELSGLELQEHLQTRPCELCEVCPPPTVIARCRWRGRSPGCRTTQQSVKRSSRQLAVAAKSARLCGSLHARAGWL